MKIILVCGAGGFIGAHLVKHLKSQGHYVIAADLYFPKYSVTSADQFHLCDLRDPLQVSKLVTRDIDEIYQLAADMGGAGYIFTGNRDADIMHNSATINLNILHEMTLKKIKKIFYSSSACVYPVHIQQDPSNPRLPEYSAYPANPDSEYGWEKLFSERLYANFSKNYNINVRIARLHNVFGPESHWNGGREKAPAALCRKVAECDNNGTVEVWGPGIQTRSFLYIDECIKGIQNLMDSNYTDPINIGSSRLISINDLVKVIAKIACKTVNVCNVPGPVGVMGRTSDNTLIKQVLSWEPQDNLEHGIAQLYTWVHQQLHAKI
jgi:GDP-D-mannose 3',5'-epimerase